MRDIREHYDIVDVLRANECLDLKRDLEHEASEHYKHEAQQKRRG